MFGNIYTLENIDIKHVFARLRSLHSLRRGIRFSNRPSACCAIATERSEDGWRAHKDSNPESSDP